MTKQEVIDQIQLWIVANGNRAITANVLRPILLDMLNQPNDLIGALNSLQTTSKTTLVAAINEIAASNGSGVKIYTGSGTPTATPPTSFATGDFYLHDNGGFQGFYQYNGSVWAKIENRKTSKVNEIFLGTVPTSGTDTTIAEVVSHINATKFTQAENTITVLAMNVRVNNVPNVYASYFFKDNDLVGEFGTGAANGVILSSQLTLNFKTTAIAELINNGTTIAIGDIASSTISDYLNATLEPSNDAWKLDATTLYFFTYTKDGQSYTDLYEGTQPAELGTDGDYVTVSTDFSTISVNGLPEGAATVQYVDEQVALALTDAQNYADVAAGLAQSNAITHADGIKTDLETQLGNKVDKDGTKVLSDVNFSTAKDAKLTGIEAGATGDMTDLEIKTAYENNADTNAYTDSEKTKLAGLESSRFKGTYLSDTALKAAHPTSGEGDYAHVDSGVGGKVELWVWDSSDNDWRIAKGEGTEETAASIKTKYESNADTNAFTDTLLAKINSITAIFTTALKNAYDTAESWVTTNGANVLTHINSTHAPSNAQKNSDILKAEIEAVLTGEITSHTHAGGGAAGDYSEERFTWATGNPNTFTLTTFGTEKVTDVYVQGKRLDKFQQDGVTPDEWQVNSPTVIEILIPIDDQDRINVVGTTVTAGPPADSANIRLSNIVADLSQAEKTTILDKIGANAAIANSSNYHIESFEGQAQATADAWYHISVLNGRGSTQVGASGDPYLTGRSGFNIRPTFIAPFDCVLERVLIGGYGGYDHLISVAVSTTDINLGVAYPNTFVNPELIYEDSFQAPSGSTSTRHEYVNANEITITKGKAVLLGFKKNNAGNWQGMVFTYLLRKV